MTAARAAFPALKDYVWFQNGGVSITPAPIAEEHARLMRELYERGPMHIVYPDEEYPRRKESVARLARFFGVDAGELALMRGVSEAYLTVLRGLEWQPGDEVIVTSDEEAALFLPSLHLRDRHGVVVRKAPLVEDEDGQVAAVAALLSERTRLVAISHVTTDLGFRLPVERICAAARERGVLTFVDLAHSAGLWPMSLRELGCDFAGILSYKWMYSPYAAGLLYVRRERLDALQVTYAGGRAESAMDWQADTYELHDSTERFQFGPWSWPLVHTWAFAADWVTDIGLNDIWQRTAALTMMLKDGLREIPGATLHTPTAPGRSAALVSFELRGLSGAEITGELRERWNIIVKPIPNAAPGIRVSIPFFALEDEVELLTNALGDLASDAARAG
ncbi:MAG TPA: aminotransferase class V-fold PLP-dependent enzyme [Thermomicrobiales bacterium]|nr:aminotransferase class V-fold PLP-dependent enzyme [Thermomicrobiales bacterium]